MHRFKGLDCLSRQVRDTITCHGTSRPCTSRPGALSYTAYIIPGGAMRAPSSHAQGEPQPNSSPLHALCMLLHMP